MDESNKISIIYNFGTPNELADTYNSRQLTIPSNLLTTAITAFKNENENENNLSNIEIKIYFFLPNNYCFSGYASSVIENNTDEQYNLSFTKSLLCHIPFSIVESIKVDTNDNDNESIISDIKTNIRIISNECSTSLDAVMSEAPEEDTMDSFLLLLQNQLNDNNNDNNDDNNNNNNNNTSGIEESKNEELFHKSDMNNNSEFKTDDTNSETLGERKKPYIPTNTAKAGTLMRNVHKQNIFWGPLGYPPAHLNELADLSYEEYLDRYL